MYFFFFFIFIKKKKKNPPPPPPPPNTFFVSVYLFSYMVRSQQLESNLKRIQFSYCRES